MKKYFAYVLQFPGGTKEQYDQVLALTNPDGKAAVGGIFHVCSVTPTGIRIFDLWESKEAFEAFFANQLGPALRQLNIPQPPPPDVWEVYNTLQP